MNLLLSIFFLVFFLNSSAWATDNNSAQIHDVFVGMSESEFFKVYPRADSRTHRVNGVEEWITFNVILKGSLNDVVTFYIQNGKLKQWCLNDRPEVIDEYLGEFCSFGNSDMIYSAIKDVLERMPFNDFLNVTSRKRPVIFTEYYDSGTARFASSGEFILTENDPLCCKEGFTIIKLGMGLGLAKTPGAIEAVVAHELAHRVLDHIKKGNINCDAERQSNRLIKKWGFTKELKEASKLFGMKKGDPAGCQEALHNTKGS